MTLIKSISGIRGTIGGAAGSNLSPIDIVECCSGYGSWLLQQGKGKKVIIGRDARISGKLVQDLVVATLRALGIDVVNLGLSTTPTVEMAVIHEEASGGIILTASHNPRQWNALKFLNARGEFISADEGATILQIIEARDFTFADIDTLGTEVIVTDYIDKHIQHILDLPLVDVGLVKSKRYRVAVDCINSTGSISVTPLLEALGCEVTLLNDDMTGDFAHNPEPLPEHLTELSKRLQEGDFDLGIAVDPDVDRLVFVCEDGTPFGEEYTIVTLADYILSGHRGNTVSNLSSTRALSDITLSHGGTYHASAVGEVNVVLKMKEVEAVFGGEGNGGVIYPPLHYGRDALVGIALFLTFLAKKDMTVSALRNTYPDYVISKQKVELGDGMDPDQVIAAMQTKYHDHPHNNEDGLKLLFETEWVHMRKSNTEPIIRIYAESTSVEKADQLAARFVEEIRSLT